MLFVGGAVDGDRDLAQYGPEFCPTVDSRLQRVVMNARIGRLLALGLPQKLFQGGCEPRQARPTDPDAQPDLVYEIVRRRAGQTDGAFIVMTQFGPCTASARRRKRNRIGQMGWLGRVCAQQVDTRKVHFDVQLLLNKQVPELAGRILPGTEAGQQHERCQKPSAGFGLARICPGLILTFVLRFRAHARERSRVFVLLRTFLPADPTI